jgi:hypothetical protein
MDEHENMKTRQRAKKSRSASTKRPLGTRSNSKRCHSGNGERDHTNDGSTLGHRLMKFAGVLKGLPSDLARNHDHYLYGTPRK